MDIIRTNNFIKRLAIRKKWGFELMVNPLEIRFIKNASEWPRFLDWWPFILCGGNWDIGISEHRPFKEQLMDDLFIKEIPYQATKRYKELTKELEEKGQTRFPICNSLKDIDNYFQGIYLLHEKIEKDGYHRRPSDEANQGEIEIRIGRNGALFKCGEGTHRLAIARLLKIRAVPATVDLIHWKWAAKCMKRWGFPFEDALRQGLNDVSNNNLLKD